jgi:hypothetical protein
MIKFCFKEYQELYEVLDMDMIGHIFCYLSGFLSIASTAFFVVFRFFKLDLWYLGP